MSERIKRLENKRERELENLKKVFVGEKYDIIKTQKFNWFAAFLGPLYLFYRKMYLYGFLYILIDIVIRFIAWISVFAIMEATITVTYPLAPIIGVIIIILFLISFTDILFVIPMGLFTNKIYLKFVSKKVEEIKNNYSNDKTEILAKMRGGTNIIPVIVISILIAITGPFLIFFLMLVISQGIVNADNTPIEKSQNILESVNTFADKNPKLVPQAEEDFTCIKNIYNNTWMHTKGKIKPFHENCNSYLKMIEAEYNYYSFDELNEATIVLGINGHMKDGTILKYKDGTMCTLNNNFTCTK